jgi:hypothetical protein
VVFFRFGQDHGYTTRTVELTFRLCDIALTYVNPSVEITTHCGNQEQEARCANPDASIRISPKLKLSPPGTRSGLNALRRPASEREGH